MKPLYFISLNFHSNRSRSDTTNSSVYLELKLTIIKENLLVRRNLERCLLQSPSNTDFHKRPLTFRKDWGITTVLSSRIRVFYKNCRSTVNGVSTLKNRPDVGHTVNNSEVPKSKEVSLRVQYHPPTRSRGQLWTKRILT